MNVMGAVLTAIHVISCILLILIVLLQSGKAGNIAAAFGGGGGEVETLFGSRTGNVLTRITAALAVVFMATALGLSLLSQGGSGRSVIGESVVPPAQSAPATDAGESGE